MSEEVKNEEVKLASNDTSQGGEEKAQVEAPKEEKKEEAIEIPMSAEDESEVSTENVEKKSAPSGKFKEVIEKIESLTALELAELVKELEERFGVSAAAPIAIAGAPAAGSAGEEGGEEKSAYTVVLVSSGDQKINVIKAVREINPELGLKEAKDVVDGAPKEIKQNVPKDDAEAAKKKLEEAGATVELK